MGDRCWAEGWAGQGLQFVESHDFQAEKLIFNPMDQCFPYLGHWHIVSIIFTFTTIVLIFVLNG